MKKIVSIFSLFILLFSCCSVAEVKDNNSRVSKSTGSNQPISFVDKAIGDLTLKTADPNYMKNHYLHLYQNYGYNLFGSCSQIAIGMLLSYYDSYWNDNIIPEKYDAIGDISKLESNWFPYSSSGSLSEYNELTYYSEYNPNVFKDFDDYCTFIDEFSSNTYYHLHLLKLSIEMKLLEDNGGLNFGLNFYGIYNLLCKCLEGFEYSIDFCLDPLKVESFVIDKIKNNTPVLLRIGTGTDEKAIGHAVIAYDYDEKTNEIYFHSGLDDYGSHCSMQEIGLPYYWDALAINIKGNHVCGKNYEYGKNKYCICELDGTHSNHKHKVFINHIPINDEEHNKKCICNYMIKEIHTVKVEDIYYLNGVQYGNCDYCKHVINLDKYTVRLIH